MATPDNPDALRAELLDRWDRAAPGWAARRERVRAFGMPVSQWMIEAVSPEPGQRLLELAAGVGDTGLIAAERLRPGGTLVSSDASEGMLDAARARAVGSASTTSSSRGSSSSGSIFRPRAWTPCSVAGV